MSSYNINDLIVQLIFAQNTQWLVCKEKPRVSKLSFKGENISSVWKLSMHHRYILRLKITLSLHAYLVFQHTSPILSLSTFLFQGSSHIKKMWLIRNLNLLRWWKNSLLLFAASYFKKFFNDRIEKWKPFSELFMTRSAKYEANVTLWYGFQLQKLSMECGASRQLTADMYHYFKLFW